MKLKCIGLALVLTLLAGCSRPAHVVWQREFQTGHWEAMQSIASDGRDIVIGGNCTGGWPLGTASTWEILRYGPKGDLKWRRTYDRGRYDWLCAIAVCRNHDIVAVGLTPGRTHRDSVKLLLGRFSAQGDPIWQREYALAKEAEGRALSVDSSGVISVCGTVRTGVPLSGDILYARFDSAGILIDQKSIDFGGDESGQDMKVIRLQKFAHESNVAFLAGARKPGPDGADSASGHDVVLARIDPDQSVAWQKSCRSGGAGQLVRIACSDKLYMAVTTSNVDSGISTRLFAYDRATGEDGSLVLDSRREGWDDAWCEALVALPSKAIVGVGAIGADSALRQLIWLHFRNKTSRLARNLMHTPGSRDVVRGVAVDSDKNLILTGETTPDYQSHAMWDERTPSAILLTKIALSRYVPLPGIWLPNMYR